MRFIVLEILDFFDLHKKLKEPSLDKLIYLLFLENVRNKKVIRKKYKIQIQDLNRHPDIV